MKKYAEAFYYSPEWKKCRKSYAASVGGLCEECKKNGITKPGEIVHHIEHITPQNIYNPEITLNYENLELLCLECHNRIHGKHVKRYKIMPDGTVQMK